MRRFLKGLLAFGAAAGALLAIPAFFPGLVWSRDAARPPGFAPDAARGAYLYAAGGCAGCHAAPGGAPAGGMKLGSPFGDFYVPNITPDAKTGIGGWSEADFIRAMTLGISPEGRHLYPAFPYASYARMTNADLLDLKAYLDSLAPVENAVRAHDLPFPFSVRPGLGLWKLAFFDAKPASHAPAGASEELLRGAYLAEGPGHCAECHTPRNAAGGLKTGFWMGGSPKGPDGKAVPNLTVHEKGLKDWTKDDLTDALKLGLTPEGDALAREMAAVVKENTSKLTDADRAAIAAYLLALPPTNGR